MIPYPNHHWGVGGCARLIHTWYWWYSIAHTNFFIILFFGDASASSVRMTATTRHSACRP